MWSQTLPKLHNVCMCVCLFVLTARQRDEQNPLERVAQQQRQEQEREGEEEGREEVDEGVQEGGSQQSQRRVEVDCGETQVCVCICVCVCVC